MLLKTVAVVLAAFAILGCTSNADDNPPPSGDKPDLIPVFGLSALAPKVLKKTITVDLTSTANYFDDLIAAQGWGAYNDATGETDPAYHQVYMALSYYALFSPAFAGVTETPSTGDGSYSVGTKLPYGYLGDPFEASISKTNGIYSFICDYPDGSGYMHMTYKTADKSFTYAQSSRIELKQTDSDRFHFLHFELAGTIEANNAIHASGSGFIVNDKNGSADGYLTFRGCKKFEFYSDADYQGVYAGGLYLLDLPYGTSVTVANEETYSAMARDPGSHSFDMTTSDSIYMYFDKLAKKPVMRGPVDSACYSTSESPPWTLLE